MNALAIISAGISALGWCLLQFVWQAAVVGAAYALVRFFLPRGNPRYVAAMLALVAMAVWPIASWPVMATSVISGGLDEVVVTGSSTVASAAPLATGSWQTLLRAALPWLVLAWAVGVAALTVRVFRQWRSLRLMLRMAESLPAWQARAREFANAMGLRRVVPVLASVRVATPTLAGWLRPAVVLPFAVLARMPASQIDLVLAHELAHLRRFDHIANLFQLVLETLFFYHPVVHWISRDARNERELCCDNLALRVTGGERRDFVAALANLEELRAGHADLALAASGGVLAERAWFIAGAAPRRSRWHLRNHAMLILAVAAVVGLGGLWWHDAAWQQRTAALISANNASVLRSALRGALHASAFPPMYEVPAKPSLRPVHYATILRPEVKPAPSVVPVRIASIGRPTFDLGKVALDPAPVAMIAVPAGSGEPAAAPRVLRSVPPVYPSQALSNGIQGRVVVEFALDAGGVPRDLQIVGASSGQLDAAALHALASWRFAPPAVPGRRYRQAFTFQLGGVNVAGDSAARPCLVTTGTHICRPLPGAMPDVSALQSRD